ncbi:TerB family tellurite resistance protein [Rhizobium paknamense]|uniref:Tellurite resistance protein B-like protein n=1 Tax=Rhizobium paknamense TaxID=1206817 RepID=A0ABU0IEI7_9HYPH|nr:TerB family tellurite resistance protein [Rhizobium paknamense]MDQ0456642.1 putative tellurite resistance protein B-like protein [Rhizobium paknamense]
MLDRLNAFFQSLTATTPQPEFEADDTRVLIVALCFQVMEADGLIQEAERKTLKTSLKTHLDLDDRKLDALLETGLQVESEAVDYYRFTSELRRRLTEEQRLRLINTLWDIVYADGARTEMEDHILWRVADLLGVSDRDRVLARQDAAKRAGAAGDDDAS